MTRKVNVIGVGMTKFAKPGASEDYNVMAAKAITAAIEDAKVKFGDVEQAFAGYVYGDSTCGQRAVYEVGLTGIPVFNVNNNCSTGSTALMLARQAVLAGWPSACSPWASRRWRRARSAPSSPIAPTRSSGTRTS
jgi:sterol carrier protein 2